MKPICRHCRQRPAWRPRGLCWNCYYTPEIQEKYPSTSKFARRGSGIGNCTNVPVAALSTDAFAGSAEKMDVMMVRAKNFELLFHPRDAGGDDFSFEGFGLLLARVLFNRNLGSMRHRTDCPSLACRANKAGREVSL